MIENTNQIIKIFMFFPAFSSDKEDRLYCVGKDIKGFDGRHNFYQGKSINNWPIGITFYCEGAEEDDLLLGGLHWYLLSDKVRETLLSNKIVGVQFLPVKVIHQKTRNEIGRYWAINVFNEVDSLHWSQVQNNDIFRLSRGKKTTIYVSEHVKTILEKNGATEGISFRRVPHSLIYPED
jgi:hypothetical protein